LNFGDEGDEWLLSGLCLGGTRWAIVDFNPRMVAQSSLLF
jgi:hypothetical protein